ncbi:hypothetical protein KGF57_005275 [Candida theae]|uniref:Uncharacterized protein n=1 Tax=Candida theae TaxID=1198502 RepID=A0AAD5BAD8_9ASCO|nr:uncharacterized protein KGF57_005275 [Candida theae]KAI5948664.1 hypothetical protein KGF57_005275 [Candida theae]
MKLGRILFHSLSLVRENQIDSFLSTPKSRQLFSDKKTYHREFVKELIGGNIENCSKSELARSSFRNHIIGDPGFKCYYEVKLCMCNFVTYLECDNGVLNNGELSMFPNLTELRVLEECGANSTASQTEIGLPKLKFLAVHVQTLQTSKMLLNSLQNLRRLDLFLVFSDITSTEGARQLISQLQQSNLSLAEVSLFLEQPYNLRYSDTIQLLKIFASCPCLSKLTIRVTRRKCLMRSEHREHSLYREHINEELLTVFQSVEQLIIDISLLDEIKLVPALELWGQNTPGRSNRIIIVDRAVSRPKMTMHQKEVLGTIIRVCGFADLSLYYGESLEESHLLVLNIVTDFVRWIVDPISTNSQAYCGLSVVSIEKCWSITDESIMREVLENCIIEGKTKADVNHFKIWSRSVLNSPRYRRREMLDLHYHRQSQYNVTTEGGYYVGTSNTPTDSVTILTSQSTGSDGEENYFWSTETSLCDFEQYCIRQRRSLLF